MAKMYNDAQRLVMAWHQGLEILGRNAETADVGEKYTAWQFAKEQYPTYDIVLKTAACKLLGLPTVEPWLP